MHLYACKPAHLLQVGAHQIPDGLLLAAVAGAGNRSIDGAAQSPPDGSPPTTTTEQVKELLQSMKDNCDYSINDRTKPDALWACRKTPLHTAEKAGAQGLAAMSAISTPVV